MRRLLAHICAIVGGHESPAPEHMQRIRKIVDFRKIGGNQDDPRAILKQFGEELVNFDLCADVDAHGWLIEDVQIGAMVQPFSNYDLLLVAAREAGGWRFARGGLNLHFADLAVGSRGFGERVDDYAFCESFIDGQIDIKPDSKI